MFNVDNEYFAKGVFQITEAEFSEPLFGKKVLVTGESNSKDFIVRLFNDVGSRVFQKSDEEMNFDIILSFNDFTIEEIKKNIVKNGLFVNCNEKSGNFYSGEGFKTIRIVNMGSNVISK